MTDRDNGWFPKYGCYREQLLDGDLVYRLDDRDQAALWWLGALGGYILSMWGAGGFACRYFPTFRLAPRDGWSLSGLLAFGLLCLTPVIIDRREDRQWTRLRSMT